jgi:hypothetical protein
MNKTGFVVALILVLVVVFSNESTKSENRILKSQISQLRQEIDTVAISVEGKASKNDLKRLSHEIVDIKLDIDGLQMSFDQWKGLYDNLFLYEQEQYMKGAGK